MTPEPSWERVVDLFWKVVEKPLDAREKFLAEATEGDVSLRHEVMSLLESHEAKGNTLSSLVAETAQSLLEATGPSLEGKTLGPYRILHKIGEGGGGVVYLAERSDRELHHRVAIKVLRRALENEFVRGRFRNEKQILTYVSHPAIANIFDAGQTDEGFSYFVMEYVDGQPIHEYCESRHVPPRERVELFIAVCSAVRAAHQHLILHCDLKPQNVLVTDAGTPKLLDFGIATFYKQEEGQSGSLRYPAVSPAYASPEQMRGEALTMASDVYALGIMLKEITEGTPFVGGEFSAIVTKATEVDPSARYPSTVELVSDLQSFLERRPVQAMNPSRVYRLRKFLVRNRMPVLIASAFLGLLVATTIVMSVLYFRSAADRQRADERFVDLHEHLHSLIFDVYGEAEQLDGSLELRRTIIERAIDSLDRLVEDREIAPVVNLDLGSAYLRIGDTLGKSGKATLDDPERAMDIYRKALDIFSELAREEPANAAHQSGLNLTHKRLALQAALANHFELAERHYQEAVTAAERAVELAPEDSFMRVTWAQTLSSLAYYHATRGDTDASLAGNEAAVEVLREAVNSEPDEVEVRQSLANALFRSARGHYLSGRPREALVLYEESIVLQRDLVERTDESTVFRRNLATVLANAAVSHNAVGEIESALAKLNESSELYRVIMTNNPNDAHAPGSLASQLRVVGSIHLNRGRHELALENLTEAHKLQLGRIADRKPTVADQRELALIRSMLAGVYEELEDDNKAHEFHLLSVELGEQVAAENPEDHQAAHTLAGVRLRYSRFLRVLDRDISLKQAEQAAALYLELHRSRPADWGITKKLGDAFDAVASHGNDKHHSLSEFYLRAISGLPSVQETDVSRYLLADTHTRLSEEYARANELDLSARHRNAAQAFCREIDLARAPENIRMRLRSLLEGAATEEGQPAGAEGGEE